MINLLLLLLFVAVVVHTVCVMPDLVKIGRQIFPTKRFYFGQTPTQKSQIQQEKNAFLRRLYAYYHIKIRYFGMKINDMWNMHEQRTTYIYEYSLVFYRFLSEKFFNLPFPKTYFSKPNQ